MSTPARTSASSVSALPAAALPVAALDVHGVSKHFGRVRALDDVSLTCGADELLVVLGPSGAGKTTLLRTIAGLEAPDAGTVRIGGVDVTRASPAERDVALVFQNFSLYPDRTVRQNLAFPLQAPGRKLSRDAIAERVAWAARLLHISDLLDRNSSRLSGGQMQRVAIGRAIVRRPRLFLMDEPLTNLDAKLRESLRVELAVLRRELKTPMVFVTHDPAEAMSMSDRVVVLSAGRVLQVGSAREIYERPVSAGVARQLGQVPINVVTVRRRDGQWVTASGVAIMPAGDTPTEHGDIGIRPEHVRLSGGSTPGEVELVEHAGPVRIVVVRWLGLTWHAIVEKSATVERGMTVHPSVRDDRVVFWPSGA